MSDNQQIIVPRKLFASMLEAFTKWQQFGEELEGFLLASDSVFVAKMRQAKKEHKAGKLKDLAKLKKEI